ncbi:MRC1-like domain-containing protein [Phycomyces blakesleeanus]|uniref:MRC1-like domain-containing protein n=1 Tax=Phycomyces blakesleeanus TaxID=4837 RepID=A0ABR3ATI3_PHYBL
MAWSPVHNSRTTHRDLNKQLQERIAREMLERRKQMEEKARARGSYTSPEERAKQILEREREAARIKMEVDKHFMKNTGANNERDEDEDENDGDYEEEGEEGDKKLRDGYAVDEDMDEIQYSGEEEEEEDDDEEEEEGRNGDVEGDDGDDENELDEDAVGISKNTRTTGFDAANSSDEEESVLPNRNRKRRRNNKNILMDDDEVQEQITAPKKPEPKNSITNFFNNQKTKTALSSDAADTEGLDKDLSKGATKPLSRLVKRTIELDSSDTEMNIEQENEDDEDSNEQNIAIFKPKKIVPKSTLSAKGPKEKSEYVEEEAQESEDEFYGQGGPEADENDENLDEYEQDGLLVERNEETDQMDEATLRAVFNKDMEERDKNMTQRLMNDITGGGLRRRLAAKEAGLMLEDYDFYDDDDMDLVAIRRAASAKRRKMLQEGGNQLEALAKDPKTAAFAKAAMPLLKDEEMLLLSDGEEEEPEEPKKDKKTNHLGSEDEESEDEETNEDKNVDVIEGEYDGNELFRAKRANILATSGFSEGLGDNDDLFLNRGYGGSKDDVDDWTVRFSAQVQIETKRSGVNAIEVTDRTKSLFKNPSKLEKFHGLLSEANGVIGGSSDTGGRKGFGAPQQKERGFVNTLGPTKDESAKPQEKRKKRLLGILGRAGSFT